MEQLKIWYRGLQPRERSLVLAGGALIGVALLYLALFGPFAKALDGRQERVDKKRQDLVWMRSMSNTVRMMAASRPGGAGGESLVVMINRTAQQAGLTSALTNQAPQGESSIRVRLEGARFDALVSWLGMLEQQSGVQVENASVDRADKNGIVNASVLLTRGTHP
jgi:general secretion pathway protein M